jgi:replicative DNA helicase
MTEEELVMRLCSIRSNINNNRLQVGLFNSPDEYIAYRTALDDYAKGALYIKRPQAGNIDEILSICEEFKFKYGIRGVTWDYMQLVTPTRDQRGMTDTQILGEASVIMTNRVAGTLGLASMCIAQLNRQDYKKGVVREAENMGGAYKIAQDATDVITLIEKTDKQIVEQGRERGNRIINVDKRRGGPSDILINAMLDKHDKISLKFSECVTPQEMIGFTSAMAA